MRVDPRHREPDAYIQDADIDLHLSEFEGYYDLVIAIIVRAYRDSIGNTGTNGEPTQEERGVWMLDGIAFFKDNRCRHWCEHLGITDFELLNLDGR